MGITKIWSVAALVVCAVLYLIWPTVDTLAIRKLVQLIAAVIGVVLWIRCEDRQAILKSPWMIFMGLLLAWVIFHAAFLSRNEDAWGEFIGQWFSAYLSVLAAIGLALASRNISPATFRTYLLVILSAQAVLYLLVSLFKGVQAGHLVMGYWKADDLKLGTDLKTSLTTNAELLAALSCAMFVESFNSGEQNRKRYLWLLPLALALYVAVFSSSLNAILLICAAMLTAMVLLAYKYRAKISRVFAGAFVLIIAISIYAASSLPLVKTNWERVYSNVSMAADVDNNLQWQNIHKQKVPLNAMGEKVPFSFYHRVARATIGLGLIVENPLGYGVTRHAYQDMVHEKYPGTNMVASSENGYINLVSAVGFPALALFLLVIVSVYRLVRRSDSPWKRAIAWMIIISAAHMALDAIERDHFFEIYLFLLALSGTVLTVDDYGRSKKVAISS